LFKKIKILIILPLKVKDHPPFKRQWNTPL
jgi:hypothetical protein